jgi:hypothetical protein
LCTKFADICFRWIVPISCQACRSPSCEYQYLFWHHLISIYQSSSLACGNCLSLCPTSCPLPLCPSCPQQAAIKPLPLAGIAGPMEATSHTLLAPHAPPLQTPNRCHQPQPHGWQCPPSWPHPHSCWRCHCSCCSCFLIQGDGCFSL